MRPLLQTCLLFTLLSARPALGQSPRLASLQPQSSALWLTIRPVTDPFSRNAANPPAPSVRPTHWVAGAVVGGVLTGLLGAALAGGLCQASDEANPHCTGATLGGFAVGALVGGTIGALIGGMVPKD